MREGRSGGYGSSSIETMKRDETPEAQPSVRFDGSSGVDSSSGADRDATTVDDTRAPGPPDPGRTEGFVLDCTPIDYENPEPYRKAQRAALERVLPGGPPPDPEPPAR